MRPRKIVPAGVLEHGEDGRLVCWDDPALQPSCHIFYGACPSGPLLKMGCCGGECCCMAVMAIVACICSATAALVRSPEHTPAVAPACITSIANRAKHTELHPATARV